MMRLFQYRSVGRLSPMCIVLLLLPLLLTMTVVSASRTVSACSSTYSVESTELPHRSLAIDANDATVLQDRIMSSDVPLLLMFYDTRNAEVTNHMTTTVKDLASILDEFGMKTAYASFHSSAAQSFGIRVAEEGLSSPLVLMFSGLIETGNDAADPISKRPVMYNGELDVVSITRWAIQSVSTECVERIESDADLAFLFDKFTNFAHLPRVLLFTAADHVGPLYRVLSQEWHHDLVFGAVVNAFAAPEKAAIAARYNISSAEELPAILVLKPVSNRSADEVVRLPGVSASMSYVHLQKLMQRVVPHSLAMQYQQAIQDGATQQINTLREQRVRMSRELTALRRKAHEIAARAAALPVRVVHTQQMWLDSCVTPGRGRQCLIAFIDESEADSSDVSDAQHKAVRVLQDATERILTRSPELALNLQAVVLNSRRGADLMHHLGAGMNGLPDVVLARIQRANTAIVSTFVGSFSASGIAKFYFDKVNSIAVRSAGRHVNMMSATVLDVATEVLSSHPNNIHDSV